jgi:hypothetical protein
MSTTRQLRHLFDAWRSRYDPDKRLIFDGPIGGDSKWEACPLRILFLLKEPHDRNDVLEECGNDLTELFANSHHYSGNSKVAERTMGRWAFCLRQLHAIHRGAPKLADQDWRGALHDAAVMNLKKLPGGKASTQSEITAYALRDKALLERQLQILRPDVVICGGTFEIARTVFSELAFAPTHVDSFSSSERLWIKHFHPSCRKPSLEKHDRLKAIYWDALSVARSL